MSERNSSSSATSKRTGIWSRRGLRIDDETDDLHSECPLGGWPVAAWQSTVQLALLVVICLWHELHFLEACWVARQSATINHHHQLKSISNSRFNWLGNVAPKEIYLSDFLSAVWMLNALKVGGWQFSFEWSGFVYNVSINTITSMQGERKLEEVKYSNLHREPIPNTIWALQSVNKL